jgi:hypothetical protein
MTDLAVNAFIDFLKTAKFKADSDGNENCIDEHLPSKLKPVLKVLQLQVSRFRHTCDSFLTTALAAETGGEAL